MSQWDNGEADITVRSGCVCGEVAVMRILFSAGANLQLQVRRHTPSALSVKAEIVGEGHTHINEILENFKAENFIKNAYENWLLLFC